MKALHFICTDFPGPGNECVFVECEDGEGNGVNAGEWVRRPDGLVALVVQMDPAPPADAATEALPEEAEAILHAVAERDCRCGLWIEPVLCESCRARAFLRALSPAPAPSAKETRT